MLDTCNYGTASRALEICRHQCSLSCLNRSWLRMCTVQDQHCCHASHATADTRLAPSEDHNSPGTCSAVISASAGPRRPSRSGNSASISRKYLARTGRPSQLSTMISPGVERLRHSLPITSGHRPCTSRGALWSGTSHLPFSNKFFCMLRLTLDLIRLEQ